MSPTLERLLLRPSVEARVQLDCVELLCVPAEPIPGCQRGLVQDGVPVVVAPSGRTDADVTHSSPIAAFLPTESCWRWITHIHLVFSSNDHPPVAASRPPHTRRWRSGCPRLSLARSGPCGGRVASRRRQILDRLVGLVVDDLRHSAWSRWRAGSSRRCGCRSFPSIRACRGRQSSYTAGRSVSMAAIRCLGGSLRISSSGGSPVTLLTVAGARLP